MKRADARKRERTFLVFFDWFSSKLLESGEVIVKQAAAVFSQDRSAQIDVRGHTDASLSDVESTYLSSAMALAVSKSLMNNGVPRDHVMVSYAGKAEPRVLKCDGAREPQNRRVEMAIFK
jgi:outer membrane protein OmpA-like peptidoglycan-associated protein